MKHLSAFWTIILSIILIIIAGYTITLYFPIQEMFGAQGGEMVQLATSHVPTQDDVDQWRATQKQIRKEIIDMTGYW
jgi:hypothetical protein